jgi:septation ring formation regulator EzrA
MSGSCFLTFARVVYFPSMNKNDLNEIKDIIDSALGTHLASVHEEITDFRRDMDAKFAEVDGRFTAVEKGLDRLEAKIDHVDEKLGNFENREIDKRLQLEVRVGRLEKQRS